MKYLLMILLALSITNFSYAEDESIELTTYYPAPYGDYDELTVTDNIQVGGSIEANSMAPIMSELSTSVSKTVSINYLEVDSSLRCTFTVPASGRVLVIFNASIWKNDTPVVQTLFRFRLSSGGTAKCGGISVPATPFTLPISSSYVFSGLTPGSLVTLYIDYAGGPWQCNLAPTNPDYMRAITIPLL